MRVGRAAAVALLLLVAACVAGAAVVLALAGDRRYPVAETSVVIPRGLGGRGVAALLAQRGVIASPLFFDALARIRHDEARMKAGEFRFAANRTPQEVLTQVVAGGRQVAVWVTIPEGFTAREIARTLAGHALGDPRVLEATFARGSLRLGDTATAGLEGYLFPDTYLFPTDATPAVVAGIMTARFRQELPPNAAALAAQLHFSIPQIVTLASLIEREAKADDERPRVAGVYYNRLRRGMPLEVDATIEYTFARHKDVITYADLARDSPYNTYKRLGLPPTPIANPGRPSLDAAFHPERSEYLYYVSMGNGHHAFARTLAGHNANVARYLH